MCCRPYAACRWSSKLRRRTRRLKIFEKAAVELLAATLGGNRNVAELGEFGVVVELRNFEFTDEFGGRIHVAERTVLSNVDRRRANDGILHLGRESATHRDVAVGVLLCARNSGEHREWAGGGAAVVHWKAGDLLEVLGVANGPVFGVDYRAGIAVNFDTL